MTKTNQECKKRFFLQNAFCILVSLIFITSPGHPLSEDLQNLHFGSADEILKSAKLKLSESLMNKESNQENAFSNGEASTSLGLAVRASALGSDKLAFSYYQNINKDSLRLFLTGQVSYEDSRAVCSMLRGFLDTQMFPSCTTALRRFNRVDDLSYALEFEYLQASKASPEKVAYSVKTYYKNVRRHQRTPLSLQSLHKLADGRNYLLGEFYECLENLAAPFPLSDASRKAFATIRDIKKENYFASLWLLRRLAQHLELSQEIAPFIRDRLSGRILDNTKVKLLTVKEKAQIFSELRLFEDAMIAARILEPHFPAEAKLIRSEILIKQGNLIECEKTLKDLLAKNKSSNAISQAALRRLAYVLKIQGKYNESTSIYDKVYASSRKKQFKFHSFISDYISKNFSAALTKVSAFDRGVFPDRDSEAAKIFWQAKSQFAIGDHQAAANSLAQLNLRYKDSFYGLVSAVEFTQEPGVKEAFFDVNSILSSEKPVKVSNLEGASVYITTESIANIAGPEADLNVVVGQNAADPGLEMAKAKLPGDVLALSGEISEILKVSKALILAIIENESAFNRNAKSWVGATGLMQLMPMTALKTSKFFKQVDFNYEQTLDPAYNILLGSGYLSFLLKYYQGSVLSSVAAYNAGPKAVNMWIRACSTCGPAEFVDFIPFNETRWYVKKVIKSYYKFSQIFNSKFDHRVVFHMPSELRDDVVIF